MLPHLSRRRSSMMTLIETAPAMELAPQDVETLIDDLRHYHALYSPLFQRREQRARAADYLHGLLLDLSRKSIEPMVLALKGADPNAIRAMQQFLSEGAWEDGPILQRHWHEVDTTLGEGEGVLTLDGSDFLKQGQASVGVKRQYCGEVGKRANCQAGVFLGYASAIGYTLLDRRLYLPLCPRGPDVGASPHGCGCLRGKRTPRLSALWRPPRPQMSGRVS